MVSTEHHPCNVACPNCGQMVEVPVVIHTVTVNSTWVVVNFRSQSANHRCEGAAA